MTIVETGAYLFGMYVGNLFVAIPMACLAKVWMSEVSWFKMIMLGLYFNLLPMAYAFLRYSSE